MTIPVVETQRLILRGHTLEDFPAYAAMRADPEVMKFIGYGDTISEEEAWTNFRSIAGHWEYLGFGTWAVEEKATGAMIGTLGYTDKKRVSSHPASGAPEMGWSLSRSAHGKGIGSEALTAALAWGRNFFGPIRVVCVIGDGNDASVRLAEKHGFKQCGVARRGHLGRRVFERVL
ncbi:MAG TPA: GNAT family N-acetyltransferase [Rhizomicrobium sp.]|nr:GNAT family N-acetyltransferase [Rhizomicrobium sp.]